MKKKMLALAMCLMCITPIALGFSGCSNTSYVANIAVVQNSSLGNVYIAGTQTNVSGDITVKSDKPYSIDITPNLGSRIEKIEINGTPLTSVGSKTYRYTFKDLKENISLKVYFERDTVSVIFHNLTGDRISLNNEIMVDGTETFLYGENFKFPTLANVKWYIFKGLNSDLSKPETLTEITTANKVGYGFNGKPVLVYARSAS